MIFGRPGTAHLRGARRPSPWCMCDNTQVHKRTCISRSSQPHRTDASRTQHTCVRAQTVHLQRQDNRTAPHRPTRFLARAQAGQRGLHPVQRVHTLPPHVRAHLHGSGVACCSRTAGRVEKNVPAVHDEIGDGDAHLLVRLAHERLFVRLAELCQWPETRRSSSACHSTRQSHPHAPRPRRTSASDSTRGVGAAAEVVEIGEARARPVRERKGRVGETSSWRRVRRARGTQSYASRRRSHAGAESGALHSLHTCKTSPCPCVDADGCGAVDLASPECSPEFPPGFLNPRLLPCENSGENSEGKLGGLGGF